MNSVGIHDTYFTFYTQFKNREITKIVVCLQQKWAENSLIWVCMNLNILCPLFDMNELSMKLSCFREREKVAKHNPGLNDSIQSHGHVCMYASYGTVSVWMCAGAQLRLWRVTKWGNVGNGDELCMHGDTCHQECQDDSPGRDTFVKVTRVEERKSICTCVQDSNVRIYLLFEL